MNDKKDENYVNLFEQCSTWLEEKWWIRKSVDWFQNHLVTIAIATSSVVMIIVLGTFFTGENPAQVLQLNKEMEKMQRQLADVKSQLAVLKHAMNFRIIPPLSMTLNGKHAAIQLFTQEQRLYWKIQIEGKEKILTSVKADSKVIITNALGKTGSCELPAKFTQVSAEVTLVDKTGNEAKFSKIWRPNSLKR